MPRVTEDQVRALVGEPDSVVDAAPAVDAASLLVTEELASRTLPHSDERLALIELYLAGHFLYLTVREGALAAEVLGDATERYHNIYFAGLRSTRFGQQAILLDTSGVLAAIAAKAENLDRKDAQIQVI